MKISDLPQAEFNNETIESSVFVADMNKPGMRAIKMKSIMDFIFEKAKKDGITVELIDNKIILGTKQQ